MRISARPPSTPSSTVTVSGTRSTSPRRSDSPSVDTAVLQALRAGDPEMLAEILTNDLQAPAIHLAPQIGDVLELGE